MRIISLAALSAALLISVPAAAQSTQSGTAATTAAQTTKLAENDADKKVCKRLATSGTRMAKRVCLTQDQWKKVDDEVK